MVETSFIRSKKLRKLLEGEGESKDESGTKISDLPDPLVHEILSNLPTKDAVRTSILSKRWVDQWKDISKIELEEESPEKREQFVEFVEKLLVVCTNSSRLKKFSLAFDVGKEAPRVNEWLFAFINPNIKELSLDLERVNQPLVFPDHVFNSATLTKFQLSMPFFIHLPPSIYFQCLKALTLKHVIFPNGSSTQQLFSSCPSLEELTLVDCNWMNVRSVCIACPLLQKLIIREWRDDYDDDKSENENDGPEGQNGTTHCQIVIIGSNMKLFAYDGDLINDYFLYCTTSVVHASIEIHPPNNSWDAGYFVFKLLKALPNVEKLSITDSAAEALCRTPFLVVHLPFFNNLTELRVVSAAPIDLSCEALLTILRNAPCLETLEFVMGVSVPEYEDGAFNIDPLPACFGTHLKTITICGFGGNMGELNAIKYLLQVAPVLEAFYIYSNVYDFDSAIGVKRLDRLYHQIIGFPRASVDCDVDLE